MRKVIPIVVTALAVWVVGAVAEFGTGTDFNTLYGTSGTRLDACGTCHLPAIPQLNSYGIDMKTKYDQLSDWTMAMQAIEPDDSDQDGASNIVEILNRTFPGDASDTTPVRGATWGAIKAIYE